MDVLQSPLEALDVYHLTHDFLAPVQSFWTWVAVLTAAVSFWSFKAVGSHSLHRKFNASSLTFHDRTVDSSPPSEISSPSEPLEEPIQTCTRVSCVSAVKDDGVVSPTAAASCVSAVEDDGRIKGKLTVYFEDNGDGPSALSERWNDEVVDDVDDVCSVREVCQFWDGSFVKRGDLGWYRYQDLTVLNGSVVRLWGSDGRSNSP